MSRTGRRPQRVVRTDLEDTTIQMPLAALRHPLVYHVEESVGEKTSGLKPSVTLSPSTGRAQPSSPVWTTLCIVGIPVEPSVRIGLTEEPGTTTAHRSRIAPRPRQLLPWITPHVLWVSVRITTGNGGESAHWRRVDGAHPLSLYPVISNMAWPGRWR